MARHQQGRRPSMSQNNQNQQRQQQPAQTQAEKPADAKPAAPAPTDTAQGKKDRIQEAVLKVARRSMTVPEDLRRTLSQCEVVDLRLIMRGLLVSVLDRGSYHVRSFMLLSGSSDGQVPKAAAETLAREWAQICESGALRV